MARHETAKERKARKRREAEQRQELSSRNKARVNHNPVTFEVDELTYEEECSIADWQYYDKFLRDNFNENDF